jgi:aminoglycoside phosphotransferase (APT) family kinase protein
MTDSSARKHSEAVILDWVEENLGGSVSDIRSQPRWRPHWFVDATVDGADTRLLVRGDRVDTATFFPLRHEMLFQELLYRGGIPVPKVYGWIDELPAFVSDCVPGRPDFVGMSTAERDAVVDEYLQALVEIHSLDVGPFVEAGIDRAARPEDSALIGMQRMETIYRAQKVYPNPFMEFCLGWFHRHPPRSHGRQTPVVWDSGQFHHHNGHLVAVLDVELGHLGDPMMDLAGWRMRDSVLGFGDFSTLYGRYADLTGRPVDLEAIELHHIAFTFSNALSFSHTLKAPPPDTDYATNLQWCNETNLFATEAIAEFLQIELPTVDPIESRRSKVAPAHAHLVQALRAMETDDEYLRHQLRISFRLARHLMRFDEIGDAALEANLDDMHAVVGRRPDGWEAAEEELERFVVADATEGRHDEALLWLFHRQNLRAQTLNGPAGSAMARHHPTQTFRGDDNAHRAAAAGRSSPS